MLVRLTTYIGLVINQLTEVRLLPMARVEPVKFGEQNAVHISSDEFDVRNIKVGKRLVRFSFKSPPEGALGKAPVLKTLSAAYSDLDVREGAVELDKNKHTIAAILVPSMMDTIIKEMRIDSREKKIEPKHAYFVSKVDGEMRSAQSKVPFYQLPPSNPFTSIIPEGRIRFNHVLADSFALVHVQYFQTKITYYTNRRAAKQNLLFEDPRLVIFEFSRNNTPASITELERLLLLTFEIQVFGGPK